MSQSDPTDNALAAIASILDETTAPPEPAKPPPVDVDEPQAAVPPPLPPSLETEPDEPQPVQPIEANGYSKSGPGPMAALRFRWTVREDNGHYFVDETIGEGSSQIVSGPMDKDAAIKFVDDREAEARQRFEHLRNEMINRTVVAHPAPEDGDEA